MDANLKKAVLRMFSYGLFAVTSRHDDEVSAMTANWVMQTSFEPPMLTLAVEQDSHTRQVIEASALFVVNIYESGQRELAGRLGKTWGKHPGKFSEIPNRPSPSGLPILEETLGWVECRVVSRVPSGDHVLFIAEVVDIGLNREGTPLTLKETGFRYAG